VSGERLLEEDARYEQLKPFGFSNALLAFFDETARRIVLDESSRRAFLDECQQYLSGQMRESERASDLGWCALLVAAGLPVMMEDHRRRGVPPAVTQATAKDLQRWVEEIQEDRSPRATLPLSWFSNHVLRGLLQIGRLQFLPRPLAGDFFIYAGRAGDVIALARGGILCRADGLPGDEADGFTTLLTQSESAVVGNPVDPMTGRFRSEPESLDAREWQLVLGEGSRVLEVHVPSGEKLSRAVCVESLLDAAAVFPRCFPEFDWQAYWCDSWLLDRELLSCLPGSSGIAQFAGLFHPLPSLLTNCDQMVERVFKNSPDWRTCPPATSLQRAIQARARDGAIFRTTSGFILRDSIPTAPATVTQNL